MSLTHRRKGKILATAQSGYTSLLIATMISVALTLLSTQDAINVNVDAYNAPARVNQEVARQMMQSGLRFGTYIRQTKPAIEALMAEFRDNHDVVLQCSTETALPDDLNPTQSIRRLNPPGPRQEVKIKAVFAPYNCDENLSLENYRVTFDIVGSVGCQYQSSSQDTCVTRSVVLNYSGTREGLEYRPIKSPPPPPPPPGYVPPPPPPPPTTPVRPSPPPPPPEVETDFNVGM